MTEPTQLLVVHCERSRAATFTDALLAAGAGAVEQRPQAGRCCELIVYAGERPLPELRQFAKAWAAARGAEIRVLQSELSADWANAWIRHLSPVMVHDALRIVPIGPGQFVPEPERRGAVRELYLEAGFAFGYGEHATTQMVSEWLALHAAGRTVLDFGTGSGILALIALACGARAATGLDIDEAALVLARRNALMNGFSAQCEFTSAPLSSLETDFDVVVANVDALTLERFAAQLANCLAPGGLIALTGLLLEQQGAVSQAFAACRVSVEREQVRDDWALLVGRKLG